MINRLYENAKVKEQSLMDAKSVLDIAGVYGKEVLEEACSQALRDFHLISYNTLLPYVKKITKGKKISCSNTEKKQGIVRGADYYRKDGMDS